MIFLRAYGLGRLGPPGFAWRRLLRLKVRRTGAQEHRVHLAQIVVHGEQCYGAHRLPAGKTAAGEESANVLLVRQSNC
jgi:hypothetical protein